MKSNSSKQSNSNPRRSTIKIPAYIKFTMRTLERVNYQLALRFAYKLFLTPIKFPIPSRENDIREHATTEKIPLRNKDATLFKWGSGSKRILLMHGWSGRASQFHRLIEYLLSFNYEVYAVEAPAHGKSADKKSSVLEFVDALIWTAEKYGPFHTAMGHSLGCMSLANALQRKPKMAARLVFFGGSSNVRNVVGQFCKNIDASEHIGQGLIEKTEQIFGLTVEEVSSDTLLRQINIPGLIFHDENDWDVPIKNAYELKEAWPQAELLITKNLGHRRIIADPKVHKKIVEYISG